jgi:hypothetical protein
MRCLNCDSSLWVVLESRPELQRKHQMIFNHRILTPIMSFVLVTMTALGLAGCATRGWESSTHYFVDSGFGLPTPKRLSLLWAVHSEKGDELCAVYTASSGWGPRLKELDQYVCYDLDTGRVLEEGLWGQTQESPPDSSATLAVFDNHDLFLSATPGSLAITEGPDMYGNLARVSRKSITSVFRLEGSDRVVAFDGASVVVHRAPSTDRDQEHPLSTFIRVGADGRPAVLKVPSETQGVLSNGETVLAFGSWGTRAVSSDGLTLWEEPGIKESPLADLWQGKTAEGIPYQSSVGGTYFVTAGAAGFKLRRFDDGKIIADLPRHLVHNIACSGNVVVVSCVLERGLSPGQISGRGEELLIFVDGKWVHTEHSRTGRMVILRTGEKPVVGYDNGIIELPSLRRTDIGGEPIMWFKNQVVARLAENSRIRVTRLDP